MLRLHHIALLAAAVALGACTQPPITPKTTLSQESATTTRDWTVPARRITAELRQRGMLLAPLPGLTPGTPPWGPYYIHVTTPQSAFLRGVEDTLKAEIIANGGTVARVPDHAVVINLKVDFIKHGAPEQVPPGLATTIGTIVGIGMLASGPGASAAVIGNWASTGIKAGAAAASGIAVDSLLSSYPLLNAEAVWTATIAGPQQVMLLVQDRFYVPVSDLPLYQGDVRVAEITTPGPAMTPPVRRMRYTSGYARVAAAVPPPTPCPANCTPVAPAAR